MINEDRWRELVHKVRNVRRLQREYFRTRDVEMLHASKESERSLDQLLETFDGVGNPLPIQSTLFET